MSFWVISELWIVSSSLVDVGAAKDSVGQVRSDAARQPIRKRLGIFMITHSLAAYKASEIMGSHEHSTLCSPYVYR